ncbi:hypothetical protein R1T16_17650 [Flavobacterium sp. DG1-102-2]|uniref:hypothetical protein n=1 Tax=Flavobacterium sp. DG1-102-2 TaxID=3081663 RepID=UPI002948F494|nr:hypothetical protein [Flavobacterium sp. DG1-102-2]MDV6170264.1 hypothetical protein [Flavobacterium sp. DG1-102-2]
MKNLNLFYTAAFAFASVAATAQIQQTPVHGGGNQIILSKEKSQAATGSMFANDKFMPARISSYDKTVLVRYNAYSDHFELSDPLAGTNSILPTQKDVTITLTSTGTQYSLQQYKTKDDEEKTGYLSIVSDKPNVKIFKRERIHLQPEVFPANSYSTYKPANYKKLDNEFYISLKGADAVYFSSKKELAKLVPAKSKEVLEFIKKNKLDLEKETDLQQLGTYLDTVL